MSSGEEVRVIDPLTGGAKGVKPERYSLIPSKPLSHVARVYGYGEKKYAKDNWRKGYEWGFSLDALFRHVEAFRRGEFLDPESGLPHLAHAVFHCLSLMWWFEEGKGTDDRGDLPPLIEMVPEWAKKEARELPLPPEDFKRGEF